MADTGLTHDVWLERVPELVDECVEQWGLRLREPYVQGAVGYTVRADLSDGTPAVLKVNYPHREGEHEAAALALWNGDGAVRLFEYDAERRALLMERCEPGTLLARIDRDAALGVLIGLLPRLWKPAGPPFRTLGDEAGWWAGYLPDEWERTGRPFERSMLDAALDALAWLDGSEGDQVLLHQDLHGDNVLAARREPWLVIDPKPVVGEREFGVAPIVRDFELGHSPSEVTDRLDRLTSELGLDRERARWWTIAQSVAWFSFDGLVMDKNLDVARWLLEES